MSKREVVARTIFKKGEDKLWYWHTKALNNEIIADGSEGYKNLDDAIAGFFKSQGVKYSMDNWPEGYVFMESAFNVLQINKLNNK